MAYRYLWLCFWSLIVLIGCEQASSSISADDRESVKFLFAVKGCSVNEGQFVAMTSESSVIQAAREQLQLPENQRFLHIHGAIERGNAGHNLDWNWHFVPEQWVLAEISMELCDGMPHMVETNIEYWVDTIGQFCPWRSYLVQEITP